jgi:hypothetical protein
MFYTILITHMKCSQSVIVHKNFFVCCLAGAARQDCYPDGAVTFAFPSAPRTTLPQVGMAKLDGQLVVHVVSQYPSRGNDVLCLRFSNLLGRHSQSCQVRISRRLVVLVGPAQLFVEPGCCECLLRCVLCAYRFRAHPAVVHLVGFVYELLGILQAQADQPCVAAMSRDVVQLGEPDDWKESVRGPLVSHSVFCDEPVHCCCFKRCQVRLYLVASL